MTRHDDQGAEVANESPSAGLGSVVENGGFSPLGAIRPLDAALSDRDTSRASSISERARRLLGISTSSKTANETAGSEITEGTRPVLRWKHQISGRWIEVRLGRTSKSNDHSRTGSTDSIPPDSNATLGPGALPINKGSKGASSRSDDVEQISKDPKTSNPNKKGGLHFRVKHRLAWQKSSEETIPKIARTNTDTLNILQRVSSILRDNSASTRTSPNLSRRHSIQSVNAVHKRRTRKFPFSRRSPYSSSSSILKMRLGIPPRNTPDVREMYTGSDGKQHLVVEMTSSDGPAYLPSEARRIGTPPLPSSSPGVRRGFYFDDDSSSGSDSNPTVGGGQPDGQEPRTPADVDWYQARVAAAKAKEKQFRFELNVPEHLPSSPLCPKHPMNRHTGGKGVCVHHGRRLPTPGIQETSESDDKHVKDVE